MPETPPWAPRGVALCPPADPKHIRARIAGLACRSWLANGSKVELAALAFWLDAGSIGDGFVLQVAGQMLGISLASDPSFSDPAYRAAATAWSHILILADGQAIAEPDRVSPQYEAEQATEWFGGVMTLAEELCFSGVVHPGDLAGSIFDSLAGEIRRQHAFELFADPYAIGAALFLEPGLPGGNFGGGDKCVDVALDLAHAVNTALAILESGWTNDLSVTLNQLVFFWTQLKGYLYAGANNSDSGISLPGMFATRPGSWQFVENVAIRANQAMADNGNLINRLGWTLARSKVSILIETIPVNLITNRLARQIAEASGEASRRLQ